MAERELVVKLVGDERDLLRALRRSSDATQKFSVSAGSFIKGAVIFEGVRKGFELIGSAVRSGIDEFAAMQKVTAQTNAALASTGGVANVTANDVQRLAGDLQRLSGIDDELIQSGSNLLLTFKNVRNELGQGNRVFDRATAAALDLSVAGFGSVESASKMLGKALNDPIRGMTALGRAGVTFTQKQRDQIKALAESGRMLEAQKLILAEVESQVGGSAKALGETLPGQLNKLREAFRNAFGNLTAAVAEPLTRVVGSLADAIPQIERAVARVADAIGPVLGDAVAGIADRIPDLQQVFSSVLGPLRDTVLPVAQDIVGIVARMWAGVLAVFKDNESSIRQIVGNLGEILSNLWAVARPTIVFLFEKAIPAAVRIAIPALEAVTGIVRVMSEVFVRSVQVIVKAIDLFLAGLSTLTDAASKLPFVGDQFAGISDRINAARDTLRGFAGDLDVINGRRVSVTVEVDTNLGRREEGAAGHDTTAPKAAAKATVQAQDSAVAALDRQRKAASNVAGAATQAATATRSATTAVDRQRRAFDTLMGRLGLQRDAAEQTRKLSDDLAVLKKQQEAVLAQIRVEGRTVDLARQLQELRQERARLLTEQRQQRQFRALGLTATGDTPIPGVAALRRQLNRLDQAVEGTFLDTRKTEGLLNRIRRVLSGGLGKVTDDVRETISRMLDDIDQQLKSRGSATSSRRVSPINANKILAGLGLSEEQLREARQRLNRLGASAVIPRAPGTGGAFGMGAPAPGFSLAGFTGPAQAAFVININGDVVTPDSDKFVRDMQKRAMRNSGTRSGVRAGGIGGV